MSFVTRWRELRGTRFGACASLIVVIIVALGTDAALAASLTIPAAVRGTIRENGLHDGGNLSYTAGDVESSVNRDYFLFDLSSLRLAPGDSIGSATLSVPTWAVVTPGPSETVVFFELDTPRAILESDTAAFSPAGMALFEDAGTGPAYGSQQYTAADTGTTRLISLNAAALAAINAAVGRGDFSLGGSVTTLDIINNFEFVYGASEQPTPAPTLILTLTTVPEPGSLVVIASSAALLLRRRR